MPQTRGPLSPFLFLLVVDVLSRIVFKGVERDIIEGFEVDLEKVSLSHLQFVDDTIFLCSSNEESFLILNHIIGFFEDLLGLKINRRKYQILGLNCDPVMVCIGGRIWWAVVRLVPFLHHSGFLLVITQELSSFVILP